MRNSIFATRLSKASKSQLLATFTLLVLFVGYAGPLWVQHLQRQAASGAWPIVTGTVIKSETTLHRLFSRRLAFEDSYPFDVRVYTNNRTSYEGLSSYWFF